MEELRITLIFGGNKDVRYSKQYTNIQTKQVRNILKVLLLLMHVHVLKFVFKISEIML